MIPLDLPTMMILGATAASPLGAFAYEQFAAGDSDVPFGRQRQKQLGVADYFVYEELLEPDLVLTSYGALGAMYEIKWYDTSAVDDDALLRHAAWINDALRSRGDGWMHQSWTLRTEAAPLAPPAFVANDAHQVLAESHVANLSGARYATRNLVALAYKPPEEQYGALQKAVFTGELPLAASYERVCEDFKRSLQSYEDSIRRVGSIRRLGEHPADPARNELLEAIFEVLYDEVQPIVVGVPFEPAAIGGLLAARDIDPAGRLPRIGSKHLRVLSVYGYPSQSQPGMLDAFLRVLATGCRLATRSVFQDVEKARSRFDFQRRTWSSKKTSTFAKAMPGDSDGHVDRFAAGQEDKLDEAIAIAKKGDVAFVHFSLKFVFLNEDLDELAAGMRKVKNALQSSGLIVREESANTLESYFGHVPFDGYHDIREGQVHTANVGRMWPASSSWRGRETWNCRQCGPLTVPALVGVTNTGEDFFFDPHDDEDSQSFAAFGAMGAGKTTDLNTIAANYRRAPNDQVFGIDKNRGQLVTTCFLGGDYRETQQYCLFDGCDDRDRLLWTAKFLANLGEINGVEVDAGHRDVLKRTLELMGENKCAHRSLSTFLGLLDSAFKRADSEGHRLTEALAQYAVGGIHKGVFDGVGSTKGSNSYEVHELGALLGGNQDDLVAAPVLIWILNSFAERFPGHRSIVLIDEAWASLKSAKVAALLDDQLRTVRFRHAGIGFFTHSLADVRGSAVGKTVFTACKTRLLYPNPEAAAEFLDLYESLDLTPAQIGRIKNGVLKRDCNLSVNGRFGSFRLPRSPAELAVFGCTGLDEVSAARRLMVEYPDDWRERFLRNAGCDREADRLRSLRRQGTLNPVTIRKELATR